MAELAELLPEAVSARPAPSSGPAFVEWAGGKGAITRELSGMAGPPQRRDYANDEAYAAARRTWRSADRNAQRYVKGERRPTPRTAARLRPFANAARRRALARGAFMRIRAKIRVSGDVTTRTMPAGGAGQWIDDDVMGRVLGRVDLDVESAARVLRRAFVRGYFDLEDDQPEADFGGIQILDVLWLRLWASSESEPTR